jgi:hypothetical protein
MPTIDINSIPDNDATPITAGVLKAVLSGLSLPRRRIFIVGSQFYHTGYSTLGGLGTAASHSVDILRLRPFYSEIAGDIDRLAFSVTTGGAGGSVGRACIYDSDPVTNLPKKLIVDGGEFDCTTVAVKVANVNVRLEPKLYWIGTIFGVNAPTLQVLSIAGDGGLGWQQDGATRWIGLDYAMPYGALPAQLGAPAAAAAPSPAWVAVRYNS